jgi:hypothetical protein
MHPRTREVLDYLDWSHADLRAALALVPPSHLHRRPRPERWSAAEVIEHLALVEARIGNLLRTALAELVARDGEMEGDNSSILPTLDVVRLQDRSEPREAGDSSQPRKGLALEVSWAELEEHRTALRKAVVEAAGRALGSVSLPHPRLGSLNQYQWLQFVGGHEARHAAQVSEIASAFDSP